MYRLVEISLIPGIKTAPLGTVMVVPPAVAVTPAMLDTRPGVAAMTICPGVLGSA